MKYPANVEKFIKENIGLPYIDYDCWQLVKKFYKEVFGFELGVDASYDNTEDNYQEVNRIIELEKCNFYPVDEPELGDIMLLRISGIPAHLGIYLGGGKFLHTFRATGCLLASVSFWKHKIEGYYRPWQRLE